MSSWNPMRQAYEGEPVTLAAFLLARIGEDETAARSAAADQRMDAAEPWCVVRVDFEGFVVSTPDYTEPGDQTTATAAHMSRWDPARVLAECEAKRQIMQRCLDVIASFGDWDAEAAKAGGGRVLWPDVNRRERSHAHDTLHTLAIPYAAHPDCREEWRRP